MTNVARQLQNSDFKSERKFQINFQQQKPKIDSYEHLKDTNTKFEAIGLHPVWPDVGIKVAQFLIKLPKKYSQQFYIKSYVSQKMVSKYFAYCFQIICHVELKKSPNLVTLAVPT